MITGIVALGFHGLSSYLLLDSWAVAAILNLLTKPNWQNDYDNCRGVQGGFKVILVQCRILWSKFHFCRICGDITFYWWNKNFGYVMFLGQILVSHQMEQNFCIKTKFRACILDKLSLLGWVSLICMIVSLKAALICDLLGNQVW